MDMDVVLHSRLSPLNIHTTKCMYVFPKCPPFIHAIFFTVRVNDFQVNQRYLIRLRACRQAIRLTKQSNDGLARASLRKRNKTEAHWRCAWVIDGPVPFPSLLITWFTLFLCFYPGFVCETTTRARHACVRRATCSLTSHSCDLVSLGDYGIFKQRKYWY